MESKYALFLNIILRLNTINTCYLKVYEGLHRVQLTASHQTTIRLVKRLGEDFDSLVKKWHDPFIPSLSFQEVKKYN